MSRGVVLLRSADPAIHLQALRTALSLSLGDRPADLLVAGEGIAGLDSEPNTEARHCLETLRQMSLLVQLDQAVAPSMVHPHAEVVSHDDFVDRLATAAFVQVF